MNTEARGRGATVKPGDLVSGYDPAGGAGGGTGGQTITGPDGTVYTWTNGQWVDPQGKPYNPAGTSTSQFDPKYSFQQAAYDLWVGLWGTPPSQKWLDNAYESGDSLFEIEAKQRAKPEFQHTRTAKDESADYASTLSDALGLRQGGIETIR